MATLATVTPVDLPPVPSPLDRSALRRRSLANLLRAGHCAPTVMRTLLDAAGAGASWPVQLVAGLPGIGNTGKECGALSASLVTLGLRHARDPAVDGVPVVVSKGRALLQDFEACHGSWACRDILVHRRWPLRCFGVIARAPERCVDMGRRDCSAALAGEERQACAQLHAYLVEQGFHCAHAVLREFRGSEPVEPALLDASSAFVGGTAYAGLTCSALTAGVMLLGLRYREPELGAGGVLRAVAGMATGRHAFADALASLNAAMERGHELAVWFRSELGTTSCRKLTRADFRTLHGVEEYIASGTLRRCREIARAVAARVHEMT